MSRSIEGKRGIARLGSRAGLPHLAYALAAAVGGVVLTLSAQPATAAQINYGTFSAADFNYINVTEDTGADEPLPLFGAPTVTGNSIDFNPVGFDATSTGVGTDPTDANLVFGVSAKSGSRISKITLAEAGDTTLGGNVAPGSTGTASAVFASGVLDIHEVDFVGIDPISVPFSFTFSPSGGTFFLGTDGAGGPVFHTAWTGGVTLDIDAILIANGFTLPAGPADPDGGATRISIDLDNTLLAVSELGTSSIIGKKDFGAVVTRSNVPVEPGGEPEVPEPSSLALAVLATAGLLARRSRRHS